MFSIFVNERFHYQPYQK
ncbi:TPA: ErmCL family antibiotic resistance leader peptide [Streptococcus agalactiae]